MPEDYNTNERLAKVETTLEHALKGIDRLTDTVSDYITATTRTNWGTIFAGLGVLVILVFGFNALVQDPMLEAIKLNTERLERLEGYHIYDNTRSTAERTTPSLSKLDDF